jgi:hypothetical protein
VPHSNISSSDVGKEILSTAMTAKGTPYAWGGGACSGPTDDQPPYDYGDVGYDCSGLVCWAVCKVTGRDLFTEGLRVTSSMYCASESKLEYKWVCSLRVHKFASHRSLSKCPQEISPFSASCRRCHFLWWWVWLQWPQ